MSTSTFDLQAEWGEACREFIRATESDLNVESPTAEQITAKLDQLNEAKEAESSSKVGKAKRAVGNTLRAVQTIGNLLTQGAQLAGFGGPANVTMNCVSFFIDAGFAYQEIAENIDDLFSRIGPVMERAEVYIKDREIIGPEMELMTHRMLMAVVKTCQHCIGLLRPPHSKRAKTKQFLKTALFHSDGDVQKQIGILITLQEQETKMASAVTVTTTKKTAVAVKNVGADVKSVATGLGILRESQKKNDEAKAEDRIKQQFKKKLGVEDNDLKLHQSKYRARRERLKLDTCAWLKDDSQYVQWSDPEKTSVPVILLSGEEGTGKSYVLTSIMQDLEKRYPQSRDDSTRISVAYFDCNRNAQSGQKSQKGDRSAKAAPSVKEMLRTWACQIMENDTFYRKDVYKVLDKADLDQLEDFLQKLFLDQLPKEAAFFLLLDETHEMDEDGCSELSALLEQLSRTSRDLSSLRIIMTTKPTLQRELESHAPSSVATIKLEERNKSDIRNYVQTKANTLACFRATSTEKQELKTWVISELPAAVNGNFLLAERKLQEINKCQDASSVRQIIEEIKKEGANLFDTIEKEVSVCNKIFSTMQVRIVNALLLWVIYAAWELQVYELESILFVQEQHKAFQPMAKEIRENYSTFFELGGSEDDEGATVNIKSSAYAEYFKDASKQRKSPDSSTNQALSKGQVQVVQHFVEKLCEKELYDKLGLAEFFDQKLKKSDVSIAVDCDNAQARITLCCLRSLAADLGEEAKSLQTYARVNLTSHLKQVDLDLVDPMIKAEIGPLLAKMFKDEAVVQSINRYAWSSWAYNDVGLSEVSRLLKSSAVIKNIVRDDKDGEAWINRVRAKNSELELLRAQKPAMAKAWLKGESTWDMKNCFMWWFGYYNKVLNVDTQAERFEEPPQSNMITSEAIEEVYEKEILPLIKSTETAAFRGTRSLGLTFLACEHVAEAIDTLNKALVVDPGDLPARNALADAYALEIKAQSVLPNWDEALRHKDIVIEQLKAGMKLYTEEEADISLRLRMSDKATWLRDLKRYEESQELLLGLLKEDPNDDENRLQLMRTLHQCQKFGHVVELIQAMETDVDESTKNTAISRFLQCHAANDTCHTVLASVYQQESRLKDLTSYYRLAINDCAGSKHWTAQWRHFYLIDRLASMLFKFGVGSTEQEEAIALWEKVVKDDKGDRDQFVRQLCKAYLAQAREAGHGSTIANAMIAKIKAFLPQPNEEIGEVDVSQAEVRALLARYYRCVGDFAKAKETLRPDMELALNLLSDEDDENDWQGYRKLGDALMDFGAMEEARAAWSLIQPSQGISHLRERTPSPGRSNSEGTPSSTDETSSEDDGDEPSSTAKHDADAPRTAPEGTAPSTDRPQLKRANTTMVPRGPLSYNCDGRCGKHWTYADDFYICCECIDIQFSPDCLKKLQAGQLEREVCDANHQFLHVPAWTLASAQRARDKKVLVGEEEKEIASWLREIEQAWQLKVLDAKSVPA